MSNDQYCIGVDFGTDSVRTIIVNARTGEGMASDVYHYPRWRDGLYCNAALNQFRQHPRDHMEGLQQTITRCLSQRSPS